MGGGDARRMPMVGFGTANRKSAKGAALVRSLRDFFALGGGLVDTAQMYHNYEEIGTALAASHMPRESAWLVSKVNTNHQIRGHGHTAAAAMAQVDESLEQLRVSHVDVFLIHLPWGNSDAELLAVWQGLVAAREKGKVRHIGVSNFNRAQIERLAAASGHWPEVNELEFHPWVSADTHALVRWCHSKGIVVVGYGNLGGSKNRARGSDVVSATAARHGVSHAQVMLRWALQQGVVVVPGATSAAHIADNLRLLKGDWSLSPQETAAIEQGTPPRSFKLWKGLCVANASAERGCKPSV